MRRPGFRGRITLATVGVLAVGLVLLSVGFNLLLHNRLDADATSVLRTRAEAQRSTIVIHDGQVKVVEHRNDEGLDRQAWVFAGGRTLEKPSVAGPQVERAVAELATAPTGTQRTVGRTQLLAVPFGGGAGTIVVGISLLPYRHSEQIALIGSVVLSVFLLLASVLAVRFSVRSALRPVGEMTRRAAEWSERDLNRRFDLGPPHDELTELASTFDGLLRRIEGVLRHEQRFSAEMAHELRTPLSGMSAEAELALQRPELDPATVESFERIRLGTKRMASVIETLLSSARVSEGAAAGSCDPGAAIREVLDTVAPSADLRGVRLELTPADATTVEASSDIVGQAVHPLLENAVRHARSRVAVGFDRVNGEVRVSVSDDGPGLGDQDPEEIFSPGVSRTGGAGLGLPLARRLARSCGGDVVAVPRTGGGHFELRLPGGRAARRAAR